jgi:putative heme-binding domain-containing protein
MIALARQGKAHTRDAMLRSLVAIDYQTLDESEQIDLLRAFELIILRMGTPEPATKNLVVGYLNPHYPAGSNSLNRSLSKLLVYLEAPGTVEKTISLLEIARDDPQSDNVSAYSDLILRNPQYGLAIANMLANVPPAQQTYYATVLSNAGYEWTPELREKYFSWFRDAFSYHGGVSYVGFINKARQSALAHVPADRLEYYSELSGEALLTNSGNDLADGPQPTGPGRDWTVEEALSVVEGNLVDRNFEQGKIMYNATRCNSCHAMRGEGSSIGPDLTQLGTRFTPKDMLESIIEPNKTVSDQYAATVFTMNDGTSILGRLINEDDNTYFISQNPFTPEVIREISKQEVGGTSYSYISVMYSGLVNRLNEEELKDLIAYLMAGGNGEHAIYKNQ